MEFFVLLKIIELESLINLILLCKRLQLLQFTLKKLIESIPSKTCLFLAYGLHGLDELTD